MNPSDVTYIGPPIDDVDLLDELPDELSAVLRQTNGFIALGGALHVRGVCTEPHWHSLSAAWRGPTAFGAVYRSVRSSDIPFAQDALGDQYLLRDGAVWRLSAESDEVDAFATSLTEFLEHACAAPVDYLLLGPLAKFWEQGGHLEPGQLLSVYPPLIMRQETDAHNYRAIAAADRLGFLASLAAQVRDLPEGATVRLKTIE